MLTHHEQLVRNSLVRKQKKARVGHPLSNTQLACLALAMYHERGIYPQSHQVRKFMYLQKHGDMEEWGSTWYQGYFQRKGLYVDAHPNVGTLYEYIEKGRQWRLTMAGHDAVDEVIDILQELSNCTFCAADM